MSDSPCPPRELLEGLALGHEPPAPIRTHVESCSACRAALTRIREENAVLAGFAVGGVLPRPRSAQPTIPGYEIVREVHRGGQGVVYLARQRSTHRDVAVKVMRQGPFATPADRSRFEREIETLSRLEHPNIVTVHDAGLADGFHYFVMNYVDGLTLDDWAAQVAGPGRAGAEAALSAEQERERIAAILRSFLKVCDAVHAAHLRGVIHRDLKPSNVCVDRSGEPHVLDFGLAKSTDPGPQSNMTRTGQFVGSLPWASPEQVEGASRSVDLRTDVYSLGAILFQLITGRPPFDPHRNLHELLDDILNVEPQRPGSVVRSALRVGSSSSRSVTALSKRSFDDELDTIVLKCLAKDPDRRYQSAGEIASDLRRYLAGEAIEARRDSMMYVLRKALHRYRMRVAAAGAFVVLLAVFAVVMAVLYKQSAGLERRASDAATSLDQLLAQSSIQQGRMAGVLGDLVKAEELLWTELLTRRTPAEQLPIAVNEPPGPEEAWWALWELYRRFGLVRTIRLGDSPGQTPTVIAGGARIDVARDDGVVESFDLLGKSEGSRRIAPPRSASGGDFSRGGTVLLRYETDHYAVWRGEELPPLRFAAAPGVLRDLYAVSASGELASEGRGDRVTVWRVSALVPIAELAEEGVSFHATAISPDGQLVAARDGAGTVHIWSIADRRKLAAVPGGALPREMRHTFGPLAFSGDSRLIADGWWEIPGRIIDLRADPPQSVMLKESPDTYRSFAFSPDDTQLAVGDQAGTVRVYRTDTGERERTLPAHGGRVLSVEFSSDGRYLISADGSEARVWTNGSQPDVRVWSVEQERFHAVAVTQAGNEIIAAGAVGRLTRIDCGSGLSEPIQFGNDQLISSLALVPASGRMAAAAYSKRVYLWSSSAADTPPLELVHPDIISFVCFSPDGSKMASAADDGVVRVWNAETGALELQWPPVAVRIPQIAFDPAGTHIAAALRDGSLREWSIESGRCHEVAPADGKPLRVVRYAEQGRAIVTGGANRTLDIWDRASRVRVASRTGHQAEIYCLAATSNDRLFATGDSSGAILLWSRDCERPLVTLSGHSASVMSLQFVDEGSVLISTGLDGTIRAWNLGYYAPYIAGQVDSQIRRLGLDDIDPAQSAAWRRWAEEGGGTAPSPIGQTSQRR